MSIDSKRYGGRLARLQFPMRLFEQVMRSWNPPEGVEVVHVSVDHSTPWEMVRIDVEQFNQGCGRWLFPAVSQGMDLPFLGVKDDTGEVRWDSALHLLTGVFA